MGCGYFLPNCYFYQCRAIEINTYLNENKLSVNNSKQLNFVVFGIEISKEQRWINIEKRLKYRLENGLIDEVDNLLKEGLSAEKLIYFGLEYKFITEYLMGNIKTKEVLFEKLNTAIRQFSKRQETYFRKMEKSGITIYKIPFEWSLQKKTDFIINILENNL
jgi:tRNA dimethylallyltransferase